MNILITMAGKCERFTRVGFTFPKWKILINQRPMLYWALRPFRKLNGKFVFVCLASHSATQEIQDICRELKILNFNILEIDEAQNGQAATALIGTRHLPPNSPFMIWNIDTMLTGDFELGLPTSGFWLTLTQLPGDCWSFARLEKSLVVKVEEKKRISDFTSIGLYGFPHTNSLRESFFNFRENQSSSVEGFVAPLYNYWIEKGERVLPHFLHPNRVIPVGTPEQLLEAWRRGQIEIDAKSEIFLKNL